MPPLLSSRVLHAYAKTHNIDMKGNSGGRSTFQTNEVSNVFRIEDKEADAEAEIGVDDATGDYKDMPPLVAVRSSDEQSQVGTVNIMGVWLPTARQLCGGCRGGDGSGDKSGGSTRERELAETSTTSPSLSPTTTTPAPTSGKKNKKKKKKKSEMRITLNTDSLTPSNTPARTLLTLAQAKQRENEGKAVDYLKVLFGAVELD